MREVEGDEEMSDGLKVGDDDDDAGLAAGTSTPGAVRGVVRAVAWRRGAETVAGTLMALGSLVRARELMNGSGKRWRRCRRSRGLAASLRLDTRPSLIRR